MLHNLSTASATLRRQPRQPVRDGAQPAGLHRRARPQRFGACARSRDSSPECSALLDQNKSNLAVALSELDSAMSDVASFLRNNRGAVKHGVQSLAHADPHPEPEAVPAAAAAARRADRAEQLLQHHRSALPRRDRHARRSANFDNVAQLVCRQVVATGGVVSDCIKLLQPLVNQIGLPKLPVTVAKNMCARPRPQQSSSARRT